MPPVATHYIIRPGETTIKASGLKVEAPGHLVPLIPVDQLPSWLDIVGAPRRLNPVDAVRMTAIGGYQTEVSDLNDGDLGVFEVNIRSSELPVDTAHSLAPLWAAAKSNETSIIDADVECEMNTLHGTVVGHSSMDDMKSLNGNANYSSNSSHNSFTSNGINVGGGSSSSSSNSNSNIISNNANTHSTNGGSIMSNANASHGFESDKETKATSSTNSIVPPPPSLSMSTRRSSVSSDSISVASTTCSAARLNIVQDLAKESCERIAKKYAGDCYLPIKHPQAQAQTEGIAMKSKQLQKPQQQQQQQQQQQRQQQQRKQNGDHQRTNVEVVNDSGNEEEVTVIDWDNSAGLKARDLMAESAERTGGKDVGSINLDLGEFWGPSDPTQDNKKKFAKPYHLPVCYTWLNQGHCPYGSRCKYPHTTYGTKKAEFAARRAKSRNKGNKRANSGDNSSITTNDTETSTGSSAAKITIMKRPQNKTSQGSQDANLAAGPADVGQMLNILSVECKAGYHRLTPASAVRQSSRSSSPSKGGKPPKTAFKKAGMTTAEKEQKGGILVDL